MIRRAASSLRSLTPSVNAEDLIALACLAGLWYGLHLISDALAWSVVSVIGLVLAIAVAVGRARSETPREAVLRELAAAGVSTSDVTREQFAALMGNRR